MTSDDDDVVIIGPGSFVVIGLVTARAVNVLT